RARARPPPQRGLTAPPFEDVPARQILGSEKVNSWVGVPRNRAAFGVGRAAEQRAAEVARSEAENDRRQDGGRHASESAEHRRGGGFLEPRGDLVHPHGLAPRPERHRGGSPIETARPRLAAAAPGIGAVARSVTRATSSATVRAAAALEVTSTSDPPVWSMLTPGRNQYVNRLQLPRSRHSAARRSTNASSAPITMNPT